MVRLSEAHGVNPMMGLCYYCNEPRDVVLVGHMTKHKRDKMFGPELSKQAAYEDKGDDAAAPRQAVFDREPCDKCRGYMEMGVILISVDENRSEMVKTREHTCRNCKHVWSSPVVMSENTPNISGEATVFCPKCDSRGVNSAPVRETCDNPYRTGGWVVVRDNFIENVVLVPELRESILSARVAFIPDEAFRALGLPYGNEDKHGETE